MEDMRKYLIFFTQREYIKLQLFNIFKQYCHGIIFKMFQVYGEKKNSRGIVSILVNTKYCGKYRRLVT